MTGRAGISLHLTEQEVVLVWQHSTGFSADLLDSGVFFCTVRKVNKSLIKHSYLYIQYIIDKKLYKVEIRDFLNDYKQNIGYKISGEFDAAA